MSGVDILVPKAGGRISRAVIFPRPNDVWISMAHDNAQRDAQTTADLEFRVFRKRARALCEHTWQLVAAARSGGALQSREARLQVEVFGERRVQVLRLLLKGSAKIDESRLARLEKLIAAILLSHAYFTKLQSAEQPATAPLRLFRRGQSGQAAR